MKTAIVAYVPVIHAGYIRLFKKYPEAENLFILGSSFINEFPRLDRDIRALMPEEAAKALAALDIFSEVKVIDKKNLPSLLATAGDSKFILPDEDVMRNFSEKYLGGMGSNSKEIIFENIFLRWDKFLPTKEIPPTPGQKISKDDFDREIMKKADNESEKSPDWWRHIGALLVKDGKILIAAHNKHLPSERSPLFAGDPRSNFDAGEYIEISSVLHGEAGVVAEAARRGISLLGASIYVTVFPCPNCAKLIAVSGIKKVFYASGYSLLDAEEIFKAFDIELVKVEV